MYCSPACKDHTVANAAGFLDYIMCKSHYGFSVCPALPRPVQSFAKILKIEIYIFLHLL